VVERLLDFGFLISRIPPVERNNRETALYRGWRVAWGTADRPGYRGEAAKGGKPGYRESRL